MSSFFSAIAQAYREIAHIAEWSSLSVGVIIGLGVLVYLDPALRKIAIRIAIGIIAAYFVTIYAYHVGLSDKQAEWTAANKRAAIQQKLRDANAAAAANADAAQGTADLSVQQKTDQEQIDALRKYDASCHPITSDQLR